jgi:hypothetical protein
MKVSCEGFFPKVKCKETDTKEVTNWIKLIKLEGIFFDKSREEEVVPICTM